MLKRVRIIGMFVAALAMPAALAGQEVSEILQTSVTTSQNAALLELEMADGRVLEIGLADGIVYVGGDEVGSYDDGGFLDSAWRDLLAGIGSGKFDAAWSSFLSAEFGSEEASAGRIAEALAPLYAEVSAEAAQLAAEAASASAAEMAAVDVDVAEIMEDIAQDLAETLDEIVIGGLVVEFSELDGLAGSFERIGLTGELSRALNGDLETPVRVVMEADEYRLPEGGRLDEMLILVETDAVIAGTVGANILVADGALLITSSGRIEGDVIGIDATVHNQGVVTGSIRSLENIAPIILAPKVSNVVIRRRHGPPSFIGSIGSGLGGLAKTIAIYVRFAFLGAIAPGNDERHGLVQLRALIPGRNRRADSVLADRDRDGRARDYGDRGSVLYHRRHAAQPLRLHRGGARSGREPDALPLPDLGVPHATIQLVLLRAQRARCTPRFVRRRRLHRHGVTDTWLGT